jgi:prepilin-type N-terminal cleavage/methylation domain-containing protein
MQKILRSEKRGSKGFSLVELLVVVAIIMVISAMALPNFLTGVRNMRMRSTGTQIAGLFEQARSQGIQLNANAGLQVRNYVDAGGRTNFYVDISGDNSYTATEPLVVLPTGYTVPANPPAGMNLKFPGNLAPSVLGAETEGTAAGTRLAFNARGLPCTGTPCSAFVGNAAGSGGYVTYFTDGVGTGAVAIYKTGRIKVYVWDGAAYE